MTKQEIIDYVMTTPGNPNRAVLEGMLDSIIKTSEEMTILTEESVTTQIRPNPITGEDSPYATEYLAYSELIDVDTIRVTFEGKQYTCQKRSSSQPNTYEYGASIASESVDFSQFPFGILSAVSPFSPGTINNSFATETAGTYQIKIEVPQE